MYSTTDSVISDLSLDLGDLYELFTPEQLVRGVSMALAELGWALPLSTSQKDFWLAKRALRHLISMLLMGSADQFQYKTVYLQQRFDHFKRTIEALDKEYAEARETDTVIFSGASPSDAWFEYMGSGQVYFMGSEVVDPLRR